MQVVVTVVDDVTGVRSDVLIDAPGSATMRCVVDALSRRTGGTPLPAEAGDADVRFADSGLVDGAVLHIGADADTGAGRGLVDLLVAGGVGAGRCVRVGVGTVRLAFTPDSETLTGSETAGLPGLEARIAFDGTVSVRLAPAFVAEASPDLAVVADAPDGTGTSGIGRAHV